MTTSSILVLPSWMQLTQHKVTISRDLVEHRVQTGNTRSNVEKSIEKEE